MTKEIRFETINVKYRSIPVATIDCIYDTEKCIGEVKLYPILYLGGVYYKAPDGITIYRISSPVKNILFLLLDIANDIDVKLIGYQYEISLANEYVSTVCIAKDKNDVYIDAFAEQEHIYVRKYSLFVSSYIIEYAAIDGCEHWHKLSIVHANLFKLSVHADAADVLVVCGQ